MKARQKAATFLTQPAVILTFISIILTLSIATSNYGTILGYVIVLVTAWAVKWDWSFFSIQKNPLAQTILKAVLYTILIIVANDFLFQPVIEYFYGATDLSNFEGLKGNWQNYLVFLAIMWIFAAFGEEFLYRGYMLKQLARIFGNSQPAWAAAILISSFAFGFAHLYQGTSGIITTGFVALLFSSIFYKNQKNLWVLVLTHGFYDVFGITLIFLDKERIITNWAMENLFFFLT
ncbi:CPBP family intramembrane glutamic endopeptidase [Draconibacterium sediminis]|uniref:CPBP family intramembrane glutamic endopeptidase n=1 Tax=Draconibacterium sediminis TaxID=1544798 RepID=UPI00069703B9|nr:type II CAAX endopeptidase family protein [Draconibacterium sediminis]